MIFEAEKTEGRKRVTAGLIFTITNRLLPKGSEKIEREIAVHHLRAATALFNVNIIIAIDNFTNVEEERLVIMAEILEMITEDFARDFHNSFSRLTTIKRGEFLAAIAPKA